MNKLRIMNLPTAYNRFMIRICGLYAVIWGFFGLTACGGAPPPAPPAQAPLPHERLNPLVERYWDEHISAKTAASPQVLADALAVERRYFDEIAALPRQSLDSASRLTYDIFKRRRELAVEGLTYPAELLAPDPFCGYPMQLAQAATDLRGAPSVRVAEYDEWLHRIDEYDGWTKRSISNMRDGLRRGYSSPRAVVERALPMLQQLGEDRSASVFYLPLRSMPDAIREPDRTRLIAAISHLVEAKLLPDYRELHDFLQREYLPRARVNLGMSTLPLGEAWYRHLIRVEASSTLSASEIHKIGMGEVDRLRGRLGTSAAGAIPATGAPLSAYAELKTQALAALPALFSTSPPVDFEIRAAEPFMQGGELPTYRPAGAVRESAVLYVDAGASIQTAATPMASFLREAIPGRHYQSALQGARVDLPRFRRFETDPGFAEGWALYAASLGEELGLYTSDEAKSAALLQELRCAVGSVVDTGLHAEGWTRQRSFDYLRTQLPVDDTEANLLIDRIAATPARALACEMGKLKIQALRTRARQVLGDRFDVREFHSEVLKDGSMPLDILERKINEWLGSRR